MRITGGKWRSRVLHGPKSRSPVRPTPDALRERSFAVLGQEVYDAAFLDLFAGTGAVGLEALSRGAKRVVFVEQHRPTAKLILRNCATLGVDEHSGRVLVRTAEVAVRELAHHGDLFDIVWADPPFETWQLGVAALFEAVSAGVVRSGGTCCLECPESAEAPESASGLRRIRTLEGGASRLMIFQAE